MDGYDGGGEGGRKAKSLIFIGQISSSRLGDGIINKKSSELKRLIIHVPRFASLSLPRLLIDYILILIHISAIWCITPVAHCEHKCLED